MDATLLNWAVLFHLARLIQWKERCLPVVLCSLVVLPAAASAQADSVLVHGRVMDADRGAPVPSARVRIPPVAELYTDSIGEFRIEVAAGRHRVLVDAYGYVPVDTVVSLPGPEAVLRIGLRPTPFAIEPLTVAPERPDRNREMFEREPRPGVLVLEGEDVRDLPAFVEPDVLRTLQAAPGITSRNDLSAHLNVRGGGPDQNLFLVDGARVFAPYHMFGMLGLINSDAVSHVDVFRGSVPARYGGAVSSVVDIHQRTGGSFPDLSAGLSFLGVRGAAGGDLPVVDGNWLVAGRRTHADVASERLLDRSFPYAFWDVNGRLAVEPAKDQRLTVSGIASSDRFELVTGGAGGDFSSSWANRAGSVRWQRVLEDGSISATLWTTDYELGLTVNRLGESGEISSTQNAVAERGARLDWTRRGTTHGVRAGIEVGRLSALVEGTGGSTAFVSGGLSQDRTRLATYAELESRLGPVRLSPGIRATVAGAERDHIVVGPRLAGRWNLTSEVALSVSGQRTYQYVSALRDDRYPLPGPPILFVRSAGEAPTRMDELSTSLDAWLPDELDVSLAAYVRRYQDVPRWRPIGARTVDQLKYDEGGGAGVEVALRRRQGRLTGWVAYTGSVVQLNGEDAEPYYTPWDRRHLVDGTVFLRLWKTVQLSSRMSWGTGTPYWVPVGVISRHTYYPGRGIAERSLTPVWSRDQKRFPEYFRADLSLTYQGWVRGAEVELSLALLNVTGRSNVLYYRFPNRYTRHTAGGRPSSPDSEEEVWLQPVGQFLLPRFPSLGIAVRF